MKVYRYKYYDFVGGFLPLGYEWKEPELFLEYLNDSDYEECLEESCEIDHLKELYRKREVDGHELNLENTAIGYKLLISGSVPVSDLETYNNDIEHVGFNLEKGYWHSAYLELDAYTPSLSVESYHNDIKQKVKDYVNTNYESYFHV